MAKRANDKVDDVTDMVEKLNHQSISSSFNKNGELEVKITNSDGSITEGTIKQGRDGHDVTIEDVQDGVKLTGKDATGHDVVKIIKNGQNGQNGKGITVKDEANSIKLIEEGGDKVLAEIQKPKSVEVSTNGNLITFTGYDKDGKKVTNTINNGGLTFENIYQDPEKKDKVIGLRMTGTDINGTKYTTDITNGRVKQYYLNSNDKKANTGIGLGVGSVLLATASTAVSGVALSRSGNGDETQKKENIKKTYVKNKVPKYSKKYNNQRWKDF